MTRKHCKVLTGCICISKYRSTGEKLQSKAAAADVTRPSGDYL